MCGGTYEPPPLHAIGDMRVKWGDWWKERARQFGTLAFFVEPVSGCARTECGYQCHARKLPLRVQPLDFVHHALQTLHATLPLLYSHQGQYAIVLYGEGDSGRYDWARARRPEYTKRAEHLMSNDGHSPCYQIPCHITLPATTPRETLETVSRDFLDREWKDSSRIFLSVSTVDDLAAALRLALFVDGIKIPALAGVPLDRVLAVQAKFATVVVKSTSNDRADYMSAEQVRDRYGLDSRPLKCGKFAPVIQGAVETAAGICLHVKPCFGAGAAVPVDFAKKGEGYEPPADFAVFRQAAECAARCHDMETQGRWEHCRINYQREYMQDSEW